MQRANHHLPQKGISISIKAVAVVSQRPDISWLQCTEFLSCFAAAAAVIRSTNAKVAALEEECRIFRQLYEDLGDTVRK
jgi:hypothetical protein